MTLPEPHSPTFRCPPPVSLQGLGDAVHVWQASTQVPVGRLADLTQVLAPDEQERAGRFYFDRDRRRYVVARGLLRMILGRYLHCDPAALRFRYGPYGKPHVAEPATTLQFNLSHAGDVILYAVTDHVRVGIDVERVDRREDVMSLARRFFSERERTLLRSLPAAKQQTAFFACWTRKEAFIKAIGEGLSYPLDAFDVTVAPETPAALLHTRTDPMAAARWRMYDLAPGPGYTAALAVEGPEVDLVCRHVLEARDHPQEPRSPSA